MKLCKDCKWCVDSLGAKCTSPRVIQPTAYLTTGNQEYAQYCSIERMYFRPFSWLVGGCGRAARFFEPKGE